MYKLVFYVPATHVEAVKEAVFAAGAGTIGFYDKCAWQTEGLGQFRPLEGSDPFLGASGELEKVNEYRVEMVCEESCIKAAVSALKQAHPYEEPAFDVMTVVDTSLL
ncbi:GTP cyclohydrolase 1 type 2 [Thalassocella blandensis]|nr:GTP cyclohydrolase 1 type 2 [Thalassocella blandensis]